MGRVESNSSSSGTGTQGQRGATGAIGATGIQGITGPGNLQSGVTHLSLAVWDNNLSTWRQTGSTTTLSDFGQMNLNALALTYGIRSGPALVIDSPNQRLYGSTGILSLDWTNRDLSDGAGLIAVNWLDRQLNDASGAISLFWENRLLQDASSRSSLDWQNRLAKGASGTVSMDWQSRILKDSAETSSVRWENRTLNDSTENIIIDWANQALFDSTGEQVAGWTADGMILSKLSMPTDVMGAVTLVAGTAVIATSRIGLSSIILLTNQSAVGIGVPSISARTAGSSFRILSTNLLDTSTIGWILFDPFIP